MNDNEYLVNSDFNETKPLAVQKNNQDPDALDIIEKRNALFNRVLSVAVAATNPNDWKDMGGRPYLEASGCEKAARRFGVAIFDVSVEREDLQDDTGRYYLYTVTGKAQLGNGNEMIEAIGTCSSRDRFFAKNKDGTLKAIQDVDIANIKKKAYTNFYGNAVRKLIGLNNLTWDMLSKFNIGKNGNVTKISYDKGASNASSTKQAQLSELSAKKPFWTNEWQGKTYINARVGSHFSEGFLTSIGLKQSQKSAGLFGGVLTPEIQDAIDNEYLASEEMLAIQSEGGEK